MDIQPSALIKLSRKGFGPPPPADLGRSIRSIEDARRWLLHPSNWIPGESSMCIIKWDGLVPTIRRSRAMELLDDPRDVGLYRVVVLEQEARRHRQTHEPSGTEA